VTRGSERALREDSELVTYHVTSEDGSQFVEDLAPPGGPYLASGEDVALEVVARPFIDKNRTGS
jgi:hypothetical protein